MRSAVPIISVLFGLCAAGAARADDWKLIRTGTGAVAFNEASIKAEVTTGMVTLDTLTHYTAPQAYDGGAYHYEATRLVFLCTGDLYRRVNQAALDERGTVLAQRTDTDWLPVDLGAAAAFKRIACTRERPPTTGSSATMASALPAMAAMARAASPGRPPASTAPAAAPAPTAVQAAASQPAIPAEPPRTQAAPFNPDRLEALLAAPPVLRPAQ